jgi:hypothetical protein
MAVAKGAAMKVHGVTVVFWLRANLEGTPRVLLRRFVDDQGRVRLERRNAAEPDWVETSDLSYTGAGGAADWESVTREQAAAVLTEWPGSADPE